MLISKRNIYYKKPKKKNSIDGIVISACDVFEVQILGSGLVLRLWSRVKGKNSEVVFY